MMELPDEPLDEEGYPTAAALDAIRKWEVRSREDILPLWEFVRSLWYYPDRFVFDGYWCLSTGGWSGNEDIIAALQRNMMFWSLCWVQSNRGGHYLFQIQR